MNFGVLGPLSVTAEGRQLGLGGPVQRRLLSALIVRAPERVSADVLIDDLWGESAPATALRTLHSHVARLRRALGDEAGSQIITDDGHYRLELARADLDAWVFEDAAESALSNGAARPEQTARDLRQALDLWRGEPYADIADAEFAQSERRRLEALRERALEGAIDADLLRGLDSQLVPELESLVVQHPFRERLWSALIVALYRSGRQADALAAYQRARTVLGEELGIDPGPELQALEARVLAHDPALLAAVPQTLRVHPCPWKGLATYQPADASFFVGRDAAVNEVLARLVDYRAVVVTGPSGTGKSSLVRAGVIPALAAGVLIGSAEWRVSLVSPGADPLSAVDRGLAETPDLLVIDSADDLVAGTASAAREFGDRLHEALAQGIQVLMTVRGDLFGRLGEVRGAAGTAAGTVLLGTPSDQDLRRVVEVPAERVGLVVEPTLVDAVIADVGGRPGCLPLLSTALVRTWERRDGHRLTLAAYLASGGATSALERLAEESYGAMDSDAQSATRHLLVRLVTNDQGLWRRRRLSLEDAAPPNDAVARTALENLSDARLVSIDGDGVQITHEALTTAWPRFAAWLNDWALVAAIVDHITASAAAWDKSGRDDVDLYRGARLQAALDLAATHPEEIGVLDGQFIEASRAATDREIATLRRGRRRLGYVAASLVLLLSLAVISGVLAVRARDDAEQAALESDAQRVGLQALGRSDTAQKLLLAVAAVRLHDDPGTRASLLAAIQSSDGPVATILLTAAPRGIAISTDGWVAVAEDGGHVEILPPDLSLSVVLNPGSGSSGEGVTGTLAWLDGHETLLVGTTNPERVLVVNATQGGSSTLADDWDPRMFGVSVDGRWAASHLSSAELEALPIDGSSAGTLVPVASNPRQIAGGPASSLVAIEDGALQMIDPANGTVRSTVSVPPWVSATVAPDGAQAAIATKAGPTLVVDLTSGHASSSLPTQPTPRLLALQSRDGLLATAASTDDAIRIWNTTNGLEYESLPAPVADISQMAWSPETGELLTIGSGSSTMEVWDTKRFVDLTQSVASSAPIGSGATTATAVDPQRRMLAVGTTSGRPWFLDLDTRVVTSPTATSQSPVVSIGFADSGRLAVTSDATGVISVWDPHTGAKIRDITRPSRATPDPKVGRLALAPDGRTAASFTDGYGLRTIDVVKGTVSDPVFPDLGGYAVFEVLGWTPDGRGVIVAAQADTNTAGPTTGEWATVDPTNGDVRWKTPAPEKIADTDAAFVEGGRLLVLAGRSGRLHFLDARSGHLIDPSDDGTMRIPAMNSGRAPASVTTTDDGALMAVVSEGRPVEIWDVATGMQTGALDVSEQTMSSHFLTEGELVTVTSSGSVDTHDLSTTDWVRSACTAANRDLTESEWAQFLPGQPYQQVCGGK